MKVHGAAQVLYWNRSYFLVGLVLSCICNKVVCAGNVNVSDSGMSSGAEHGRPMPLSRNRTTPPSERLGKERLDDVDEVIFVTEEPGQEVAPSRCYVCRNESATCSFPSEMIAKICDVGNEACVKYGENTQMVVTEGAGITPRNITGAYRTCMDSLLLAHHLEFNMAEEDLMNTRCHRGYRNVAFGMETGFITFSGDICLCHTDLCNQAGQNTHFSSWVFGSSLALLWMANRRVSKGFD